MATVLFPLVLVVLLTGYLVLDGCAFGIGLLVPWSGGDDEVRRDLVGTVGPFFLGHEVWIVATAGVLFGAFPDLDGVLLSGFYPLVVLLVGGMVVRDTALWFRSRFASPSWRRAADRALGLASLVLTVGWGALLGALARGLPAGGTAPAGGFLDTTYPLFCGAACTVLMAFHGAVFVAARSRGPLAADAAGTARRLAPMAAAGLLAALAGGVAVGTSADPALAIVLVSVASAAPPIATRFLRRGLHRSAVVVSAASVGLPVIAVGIGRGPAVTASLAAPSTLALLTTILVAVLPAMASSQLWLWWTFRRPLGPRSARYF